MDLWVVAAAAGAGYLAKNWQHFLKDNEGLSRTSSGKFLADEPESPSLIQRVIEKTCPISKLSRIKAAGQEFSDSEKGFHSGETSGRNGLADAEGSSSTGSDHDKQAERCDDRIMPSSSMLSPQHEHYKGHDGYRDGCGLDGDMGDIPENRTWEMGASQGSHRRKNSLRSRRPHLQYIKPRTSLDSCLLAQMHREHVDMEEYLRTPLSSPCTPSVRPFLVTDGKRVISRAGVGVRDGLYNKLHPKANDEVVGVPRLPQVNASDFSKLKSQKAKNQMKSSYFTSKSMQFDAWQGSLNGRALFCLGISIGIITTIVASKVELEKLKERLKHSENLVEDLQEELEMKDSLTVKELANDDDPQGIQLSSSSSEKMNSFADQADASALVSYADKESVNLKTDESISNIEAELEAELERLELSMKGSTLQGTLLDSTELGQGFDEDVIVELVHGELQAELVRGRSSSEPTPDRGSHSPPTPLSAKDGVSPRELSLRLYEVIQSRLEKRVMELEEELVKSQKRIQQLETERINHRTDVLNSGSSSSRCSPKTLESHSPMVQPLVMNLSGDALDAYNEVFDELYKIEGSENGSSPIQFNSEQDEILRGNQVTDGRESGLVDGSKTWLPREEPLPISITGIPSSDDSPGDYYDKAYDDDNDLLLIQQIVEKAKQGSPAILRAQRAMVSLDRHNM